jgi:hypothetical protein
MDKQLFLKKYSILKERIIFSPRWIYETEKIPLFLSDMLTFYEQNYYKHDDLSSLNYQNVMHIFIKTINVWLDFFNSENISLLKKDSILLSSYKEMLDISVKILNKIKTTNISKVARLEMFETLNKCELIIEKIEKSNIVTNNYSVNEFIDKSRTYGTVALIVGVFLFIIGLMNNTALLSIIGFILIAFSLQFVFAGR